MAPIRFTVIITFYNQEAFVRTALDSILAQRRDHIEVIAVDDASTDGTHGILLDYGTAVKRVVRKRNEGVSAARQAGAAMATGDYLAFLDGDDAFMPWALDVYETIVDARQPVIIVGPMLWFEGAVPHPGDYPRATRFVEYPDFFAKDRAVGVSASAMVIRRRSFDEVGGWQRGLHPMEDHDLLWKLGTAGPAVQIIEPATTLHRSHPSQTTRQTSVLLNALAAVVTQEKEGKYPGGTRRSLARRASVGGALFHWTAVMLKRHSYRDLPRVLRGRWTFAAAAVVLRLRRLVFGGRRSAQTIPLSPTLR